MLPRILEAIARAERSVHIEVMTFFNGDAGYQFSDALLQRLDKTKGSTAASVMLYNYEYPMGISAMEASLRQQGQGAVSSDGQRLLYVVVSGQGGGAMSSQQLLQQILR